MRAALLLLCVFASSAAWGQFSLNVGPSVPATVADPTTPLALSATSTTVYAYQSSLVTVAGIQVSLLGLAGSAGVGLWVCGY